MSISRRITSGTATSSRSEVASRHFYSVAALGRLALALGVDEAHLRLELRLHRPEERLELLVAEGVAAGALGGGAGGGVGGAAGGGVGGATRSSAASSPCGIRDARTRRTRASRRRPIAQRRLLRRRDEVVLVVSTVSFCCSAPSYLPLRTQQPKQGLRSVGQRCWRSEPSEPPRVDDSGARSRTSLIAEDHLAIRPSHDVQHGGQPARRRRPRRSRLRRGGLHARANADEGAEQPRAGAAAPGPRARHGGGRRARPRLRRWRRSARRGVPHVLGGAGRGWRGGVRRRRHARGGGRRRRLGAAARRGAARAGRRAGPGAPRIQRAPAGRHRPRLPPGRQRQPARLGVPGRDAPLLQLPGGAARVAAVHRHPRDPRRALPPGGRPPARRHRPPLAPPLRCRHLPLLHVDAADGGALGADRGGGVGRRRQELRVGRRPRPQAVGRAHVPLLAHGADGAPRRGGDLGRLLALGPLRAHGGRRRDGAALGRGRRQELAHL